MSYEVRAIEYRRPSGSRVKRVRLVKIIAHNVPEATAIDMAARYNEEVQPDEPAWVSELPSESQVKP